MEENIKNKLGNFFRGKRKKREMSTEVLSELTGIHMGAISKFERGITDMKTTNLLKIIAVLQIDTNDLAVYPAIIAQELGIKKNEHVC